MPGTPLPFDWWQARQYFVYNSLPRSKAFAFGSAADWISEPAGIESAGLPVDLFPPQPSTRSSSRPVIGMTRKNIVCLCYDRYLFVSILSGKGVFSISF
jgi:hypothetical protein